jgi:ABC-type nitrate/sulfonate/bicarbonate transport system permease component
LTDAATDIASRAPARRRVAGRRTRPPVERFVGILSPIAFLVLWEIAARLHLIDVRIFPAPTVVAATIWTMAVHGSLMTDTAYTVMRFLCGIVLGVVPGLFLGLTMGLFRWVGIVFGPIIAIFYNVPRIALFPLVLILVGLNESSNILMIALGPFFTMLITAMGAVTNVEQIYRDVAKNFAAKPRHLYFMVTLPAIAPTLMDGLRISVGLGLLGTIAVEFLVAEDGLGHVIWNSWQVLSLSQSMAGLVMAAIVGYVFYASLAFLERLLIPWHQPTRFR